MILWRKIRKSAKRRSSCKKPFTRASVKPGQLAKKLKVSGISLVAAFYNEIKKFSLTISSNIPDRYGVQFVTQCFETLPTSTRPVQVSILTTLNRFVDKLVLLKTDSSQTSEKDKEMLNAIVSTLLKILRYAIGM